jgi:hypothetical protein
MNHRPFSLALSNGLKSAALVILVTALGCSSSSDTTSSVDAGADVSVDSAADAPGDLSAFGTFCTGTLLKQSDIMSAQPPAGWSGNGQSVPAGTTVLIGASFNMWNAFGFLSNGTVFEVSAPFATGLVKDTDFASDCATASKLSFVGTSILLLDATFYATQDLTGTPCPLKKGTVLTSLSYITGSPASVGSDEIQSTCKLSTAYSNDIMYGSLIVK